MVAETEQTTVKRLAVAAKAALDSSVLKIGDVCKKVSELEGVRQPLHRARWYEFQDGNAGIERAKRFVEALGLDAQEIIDAKVRAAPEYGSYRRDEYSNLEGDYLLVRPDLSKGNTILAYGMVISWDVRQRCFVLYAASEDSATIDHDAGFMDAAKISIPDTNAASILEVHSRQAGLHSLSIFTFVRNLRRPMPGAMLTLGAVNNIFRPALCRVALLPRNTNAHGETGYYSKVSDGAQYDEYREALNDGPNFEEFFFRPTLE